MKPSPEDSQWHADPKVQECLLILPFPSTNTSRINLREPGFTAFFVGHFIEKWARKTAKVCNKVCEKVASGTSLVCSFPIVSFARVGGKQAVDVFVGQRLEIDFPGDIFGQ